MTIRMTYFLIAISILAIAHQVATTFFLYWKYFWFDIPMHLLGGACVALGYAVLPFFKINLPPRYGTPFAYLVFVLVVGILWEVFEFSNGISLAGTRESLVSDTASDLMFDLIGGYVGYLVSKHTPN